MLMFVFCLLVHSVVKIEIHVVAAADYVFVVLRAVVVAVLGG